MPSLIFKVCPLLRIPSDTAARLRAALRDSKSLCIQRYTLGDRHTLQSVWERLGAYFSFMVMWLSLLYALKRFRMACKGLLSVDTYHGIHLMTDIPYRASGSVWEAIPLLWSCGIHSYMP